MSKVRPFPARPPQEPPPGQKIPEKEVVKHRPWLPLSVLRNARAAKKIRWYIGPKRSAWYTLADVDAFIEGTRCRNPEAESHGSTGGDSSTVTGLSPEQELLHANRLAQRI